jgi:hypothetical protein
MLDQVRNDYDAVRKGRMCAMNAFQPRKRDVIGAEPNNSFNLRCWPAYRS